MASVLQFQTFPVLTHLDIAGVPRILEDTLPPHLNLEDRDWKPYREYMSTTRINVNVRQVFPKGFKPTFESR